MDIESNDPLVCFTYKTRVAFAKQKCEELIPKLYSVSNRKRNLGNPARHTTNFVQK